MSRLTQGFAVKSYSDLERRAGAAWEALAALPIDNPERNKLRDVVRATGEALDRKAHKFLTLAAEYSERERLAKRKAAGDDVYTYERWLKSFMKPADVKAALAKHRAEGYRYFREERPACTHPVLTPTERKSTKAGIKAYRLGSTDKGAFFCGQCGAYFKDEQRAAAFDAMRESLAAGVQVVSAPQLFPTPPELAARMVELAGIEPGAAVLEPSAGTGRLLGAMGGRMFGHNPERGAVVAVELVGALADGLRREFPLTDVRCADFLQCNGDLGTFDRIVMNPPFANGADIKHIQHALTMLNPGGRLVALCANGPRQAEALQPIATSWEEIPAGTFAGTGVRAALLTVDR